MRKRFGRGGGRGRRGAPEARAIDVGRAVARIVEVGVAGVRTLEPLEDPDVPATFAALGRGEGEAGPLVVGFSLHDGGDAALGVIAAALRLAAEQGFDGEVVAVAPQWSVAARRRLALIGELPLPFRGVAATPLGEDGGRVQPHAETTPALVSPAQTAAALPQAAERELFLRAAASLEGLAAKHGGAVRGVPEGAELVLLARRVARLRAEGGLELETFLPEPSSSRLAPATLARAMDRLEGLLRKYLNDRRIRSSEEGLRAQLSGPLAAEAELRGAVPWPLPGSDPEVIDLVGVQPDGGAVVAAIRKRLGLPGLAAILDALAVLRPALPTLAAGAPLRLGAPRLLLAARDFDAAALRVLPALALEVAAYTIAPRRGREPALERRPLELPTLAPAGAPARKAPEGAPAETTSESPAAAEADVVEPEGERPSAPARPRKPRFEEVSFFDLDEEQSADRGEEDRSSSRRRRRGRRRRGGGRGAAEEAASGEGEVETAAAKSPSRARGPREEPPAEDVLDDLDLSETLAPLSEEVPDLDETPEPSYDEEEPEAAEEVDAAEEARRVERDARRRARLAKTPPEPEPEPEAAPRVPRRRAAIVAHADRDSLLAALLLARDLRLLEGFWIYPQSELMTFFRSVATDLREETPICVVGFTASPARDTIQAASLYAGRIDWFDHHEWPPEDLEALRAAIGREHVVVLPGTGSAVPAVLSVRTRRSRFSDKLVELATGCFTHHDYERWGRVWWQRLTEAAGRSGERRADLEQLLVGRPSDLAREAVDAPTPPLPPEVAYVSERDFRLVHFGGYTLVVVPVPPELDLHLAGRIARERYGASLSLCHRGDAELVVLGGDEGRGRRGVDLGRMVDHLASKHDWIEALPDPDHVARLRVQGLPSQPERLDEVIREIAMGRSILEG